MAKDEGVGASPKAADAKTTGSTGSGQAFADKLSAAAPTQGTQAASGIDVARPPGEVAVRDLAGDLETGKLDARAVVDKLIDRVIDAQLGPDAPSKVRQQVEAALREAVESDPLLAAKLSRIE